MDKSSKQRPEFRSYTRRRFLKHGALTTFGWGAAHRLSLSFDGLFSGVSSNTKSKVVLVRHPAVVDAAGKVQSPLLQNILDKAITTFTGRSTVIDAWRQFVSPDDVVGLKINTLGLMDVQGTDYTQHFAAIIEAIAQASAAPASKIKT
jgi:hypothetical protein